MYQDWMEKIPVVDDMNVFCRNCGKCESCQWALKGTYKCDLWKVRWLDE